MLSWPIISFIFLCVQTVIAAFITEILADFQADRYLNWNKLVLSSMSGICIQSSQCVSSWCFTTSHFLDMFSVFVTKLHKILFKSSSVLDFLYLPFCIPAGVETLSLWDPSVTGCRLRHRIVYMYIIDLSTCIS